MEKLGNKEDEESEEDDGEENSDEEDSDEKMDAEEQHKVPAKSQPARTILRPKRKAPAAASKVIKEETKQMGSKKQPAARSRSKQAKISNDDNVDVDDLIKTDLAQPMSQPEIGKKRKHPVSGPFKDDLIP